MSGCVCVSVYELVSEREWEWVCVSEAPVLIRCFFSPPKYGGCLQQSRKNALKKMKFVRAERLVKSARQTSADNVRIRHLNKTRRNVAADSSKLLLVARIKRSAAHSLCVHVCVCVCLFVGPSLLSFFRSFDVIITH